jgi:hypothetical protein
LHSKPSNDRYQITEKPMIQLFVLVMVIVPLRGAFVECSDQATAEYNEDVSGSGQSPRSRVTGQSRRRPEVGG